MSRFKGRVLSSDDRGTSDLIWRLLMMVILIGAVIPVGIFGFTEVNRTRIETGLRRQIEELLFLSRSISQEGNLSRTNMELDLMGKVFAEVEYVKIGDTIGGLDSGVRYRCSWESKQSLILSEDEDLRLTSPGNNTLTLDKGKYQIILTHVIINQLEFIVLSIGSKPIDYDHF